VEIGMKNDQNIEKQVIELRRQGYSRNEISRKLHLGHSKVQFILNKHKLSAKHGLDYRKPEVIKRRRSKIKNKKVLKKIEKPKKKKVEKIRKKKVVKKKVKPKRNINKYLYGYIRYSGYKGMYLYKGEMGTSWYRYIYNEEIPDIKYQIYLEAIDKVYRMEQSLSNFNYTIDYIDVRYDADNNKIIYKKRL
jgi:hypothetical protein